MGVEVRSSGAFQTKGRTGILIPRALDATVRFEAGSNLFRFTLKKKKNHSGFFVFYRMERGRSGDWKIISETIVVVHFGEDSEGQRRDGI